MQAVRVRNPNTCKRWSGPTAVFFFGKKKTLADIGKTHLRTTHRTLFKNFSTTNVSGTHELLLSCSISEASLAWVKHTIRVTHHPSASTEMHAIAAPGGTLIFRFRPRVCFIFLSKHWVYLCIFLRRHGCSATRDPYLARLKHRHCTIKNKRRSFIFSVHGFGGCGPHHEPTLYGVCVNNVYTSIFYFVWYIGG